MRKFLLLVSLSLSYVSPVHSDYLLMPDGASPLEYEENHDSSNVGKIKVEKNKNKIPTTSSTTSHNNKLIELLNLSLACPPNPHRLPTDSEGDGIFKNYSYQDDGKKFTLTENSVLIKVQPKLRRGEGKEQYSADFESIGDITVEDSEISIKCKKDTECFSVFSEDRCTTAGCADNEAYDTLSYKLSAIGIDFCDAEAANNAQIALSLIRDERK